MAAWMRTTKRMMTEQRRRKPGAGRVLRIPHDAESDPLTEVDEHPVAEIHLEATNGSSDLSCWLDDHFWMEAMRRWSGDHVVVHIEPTRNALLHEVVLHQLNMLRRVAPNWRLVGHCYASDLVDDTQLTAAALSPYHELDIVDAVRPGRNTPARAPEVQQLSGRLRRTQEKNGRTTPVIGWREPEAEVDMQVTPFEAAADEPAVTTASARR